MGYSIITVKFIRRIHKPNKRGIFGLFPSQLLGLVNYCLVSTISLKEFFNTAENIPKKSVVCISPNIKIPLFDNREDFSHPFLKYNFEKLYRDNIERYVEEDLRRDLLFYGMV